MSFQLTLFSACDFSKDDGTIEIVIWEDESEAMVRAVHDEVIEEFISANPDIKVKEPIMSCRI